MAVKHLTTGEVARICGVAPRTAASWIDGGKLRGHHLPGTNHRRVEVKAMREFLEAHNMPVEWLDRHLAGRPSREEGRLVNGYGEYLFSCTDATQAVREILRYVAQIWPAAACESLLNAEPAILVGAYLRSNVSDVSYLDVNVYQSHQVSLLADVDCTLDAVKRASINFLVKDYSITIGIHSDNVAILDWIRRGDHSFHVLEKEMTADV